MNLIEPEWLTSSETLAVLKDNDMPLTKGGLLLAAAKYGLGKKDETRHWRFDANIIDDFIKHRKKKTLSDIAREIGTRPSSLYYQFYKLGKKVVEKFGTKVLEDEDAKELIRIYRKNPDK